MRKVKRFFIFLICIVFPVKSFALSANFVSIEANQYVSVGEPVKVSVLVTHDKNAKVDESSFKMDGKQLSVRYVKEIKMSENSDLVISVYQYTIPAEKRGAYTIPPVSVNIGGKIYTSYESSYEVE